jgi:hypothetical protein
MRHNAIVDSLATAMRKCGVTPEVEPAGYCERDNRRPDVFAVLNGRPTFIDVGVVHPSAPSHRNKKPFAAAESYVKQKVDKYRELAERNDAVIIPFTVEPVEVTRIKPNTSWTTLSLMRTITLPPSPRNPFGMSSWTLSQ